MSSAHFLICLVAIVPIVTQARPRTILSAPFTMPSYQASFPVMGQSVMSAPVNIAMAGQTATMTGQPMGGTNTIFLGEMPDIYTPDLPDYYYAPGMTFGGGNFGGMQQVMSGVNTNTVVNPTANVASTGVQQTGRVQTINTAAMPFDGTYLANGGTLEITRDGRDLSFDHRFL